MGVPAYQWRQMSYYRFCSGGSPRVTLSWEDPAREARKSPELQKTCTPLQRVQAVVSLPGQDSPMNSAWHVDVPMGHGSMGGGQTAGGCGEGWKEDHEAGSQDVTGGGMGMAVGTHCPLGGGGAGDQGDG